MVARYAPDGDLTGVPEATIEGWCGWGGRGYVRGKCYEALVEVGWIDVEASSNRRRSVHDWSEYQGKRVEKAHHDAEVKRARRSPAAYHPQPAALPTVRNGTEQYGTDPDQAAPQTSPPPQTPAQPDPNPAAGEPPTTKDIVKEKKERAKRSHPTLEAVLADTHQPTGRTYAEHWPEKFSVLARSGRMRDALATAWDHAARKKRTDMVLYLDGWLRRDEERLRATVQHRGPADHVTVESPLDRQRRIDRERQREYEQERSTRLQVVK